MREVTHHTYMRARARYAAPPVDRLWACLHVRYVKSRALSSCRARCAKNEWCCAECMHDMEVHESCSQGPNACVNGRHRTASAARQTCSIIAPRRRRAALPSRHALRRIPPSSGIHTLRRSFDTVRRRQYRWANRSKLDRRTAQGPDRDRDAPENPPHVNRGRSAWESAANRAGAPFRTRSDPVRPGPTRTRPAVSLTVSAHGNSRFSNGGGHFNSACAFR